MLKSFYLLILSSILSGISTNVNAKQNEYELNLNPSETTIRTSIIVRVRKEYIKYFDGNLVKILELYNIYLDRESKYQIHEENNYIELSCFNCVLRINSQEGFKKMGANSYGGSSN